MRSSDDLWKKIPLIADMGIALGVVASFAYCIIVMEYHVGAGELTHAELLLLGAKKRTAHSTEPSGNNNKRQ